MRLLQHRENGDISLTEHVGELPPYAILSHTWGADNEEVTFKDLVDGTGTEKEGYRKLKFCGQQAARHGLKYYWIDTCCIDKASSAELSEAINSMFRWYQNSARCYVYLADVSTTANGSLTRWKPDFKKSKWFTRGWTLQELIAPRKVEFFSREGQLLGSKLSLLHTLQEVTDVALKALEGGSLGQFSIEERFSWAIGRQTKREEDEAYSLFGLFNVHMPLIYGEGREKARKRLLREIEEYTERLANTNIQQDHQRETKLEEICQWLSKADPSTNFEQALKQRQEQTGLWLLNGQQYQTWKNGAASFMWLHGIPGSGKTILSSSIIHDILVAHQHDRQTAVLYFYFDFNDSQKQHPDSLLRSLIQQLLRQLNDVVPSLNDVYALYEHGRQQPTQDELLDLIKELTQRFLKVYIVLDALDECSERAELMQNFAKMSQWHVHNLRVFVTSRRDRDIEDGIEKIRGPKIFLCLESEIVDEDIRQYVQQKLSYDKSLSKWGGDSILRHEIETALIQGSQGMFRWAECQLNTLGRCRSRAALRKSLRTLPATLERTYDEVLHKISEEDQVYAIRVLRWLTFAERPMFLAELAEVVAVEASRDPAFDEEEVLQEPMEILDICSSLITIRDARDGQGSPSMRVTMLAHYSVKEYLLSDKIRTDQIARYSMHPSSCHNWIATACLNYLQPILQLDSEFADALERSELLDYCAAHWMNHAERAIDWDSKLTEAAVRLLSVESQAYLNWVRVYDPERTWNKPNATKVLNEVAHPLYYAASFGLTEVVDLLLKRGTDANAHGGEYGSALQAAAGSGHDHAVRLLIAHGADVDALNSRYGNAVQAASEGGHEEVVKRLIDAGADLDAHGGRYGCALELAIGNDHTTLVELLLKNGANADISGHEGATPLVFASSKGHLHMVKLLIEHGATISAMNETGWTSVNIACDNGHLEIVELLVRNGASLEVANKDGWTPLNSASDSGQTDVVELLLQIGVDLLRSNVDGWTPLISAASNDHSDVVNLLLKHDKDDCLLDMSSKFGYTALHVAASKGHSEVVRLLIEKGANVVQEDIHGIQAMGVAAARGHESVLAVLLGLPSIGPNYKDRYCRTAVWWAAAYNGESTINFLLQELQADPDIADALGRTPLMIASRGGSQDAANTLQRHYGMVIGERELEVGSARHRMGKVVCDICQLGMPAAEIYYHCSICANGDWDTCKECKEEGGACLDDTHILIERTMQKVGGAAAAN